MDAELHRKALNHRLSLSQECWQLSACPQCTPGDGEMRWQQPGNVGQAHSRRIERQQCDCGRILVQLRLVAEHGTAARHRRQRELTVGLARIPAVDHEPPGCDANHRGGYYVRKPMDIVMQSRVGSGARHAIARDAPDPPVIVTARFRKHGPDRKGGARMQGWK